MVNCELWFEGDVIPKALIYVLAEEDRDEYDMTDEIHTTVDEDEEETDDDNKDYKLWLKVLIYILNYCCTIQISH